MAGRGHGRPPPRQPVRLPQPRLPPGLPDLQAKGGSRGSRYETLGRVVGVTLRGADLPVSKQPADFVQRFAEVCKHRRERVPQVVDAPTSLYLPACLPGCPPSTPRGRLRRLMVIVGLRWVWSPPRPVATGLVGVGKGAPEAIRSGHTPNYESGGWKFESFRARQLTRWVSGILVAVQRRSAGPGASPQSEPYPTLFRFEHRLALLQLRSARFLRVLGFR